MMINTHFHCTIEIKNNSKLNSKYLKQNVIITNKQSRMTDVALFIKHIFCVIYRRALD